MNSETQLLTVRQFAEKHPFISQGGLRWLIYSNASFREQCTRQLGRRVLLIEAGVIEFILQGHGQAKEQIG